MTITNDLHLRMKNKILYIILALILLILWEYFGRTNNSVRIFISSPSLSYNYFIENLSNLLLATFTTFYESLMGLIIATLFSFLLMIICFYRPSFLNFIIPIMVSSQVIPIIVFAPFIVLLLGIGVASKIVMASIISFFPIFINFCTGYNSIQKNILELLEIYNADKTFRIFKVYFPLSLQNIFTGLKISSTLAVIGAIVAEFTGAEIGLGKNLFLGSIRLEPELLVNSVVLSALLGGTLFYIVYLLEQYFGKWYIDNYNFNEQQKI